ncbi:MAG: TetR/AcrR family transcriptional regulator [Saprospiraceae bacterium]|nr:TetR/AcrR family transcriptional regulator [Saprospiraceae bacterium]MBP9188492.1 TetR/AcrR family transcriptional regulator [Chitinophagales bacterium]
MGKTTKQLQPGTEEQILNAARRVFTRKGFAAARMEDIAQEAGINRALLHYYFRSKDKMFDMVFKENMGKFFQGFITALQGKESFEEKIKRLISGELDTLIQNQDLPLFIVNEIAHNPEKLIGNMQHSHIGDFRKEFEKLVKAEIRKGNIKKVDPRQLMMNLLAMSVWPFIAKPLLMAIMDLDQKTFEKMMLQRKEIIADSILLSIKK